MAHLDADILSLATPDREANLAELCESPVFQPMIKNAEKGELLSLDGVCQGGEAFIIAVLAQIHPRRPVVVVCPTVQTQEQVHQELETWMPRLAKRSAKAAVPQFSRPGTFCRTNPACHTPTC